MNEPQHGGHAEPSGTLRIDPCPTQAGEPVGRLHAGHAQQMNDALEKGAVVREQLRLVPREEIGR